MGSTTEPGSPGRSRTRPSKGARNATRGERGNSGLPARFHERPVSGRYRFRLSEKQQRPLGGVGGRFLRQEVAFAGLELALADGLLVHETPRPLEGAGGDPQLRRFP